MKISYILFAAMLAGGMIAVPHVWGEESTIAPSSLAPSPAAREALTALDAIPLDQLRTSRLAERYQHIVTAAGLTVPMDTELGFDATWIVASCWQPSVADALLAAAEDDDIAAMRFFVYDPQGLAAAKARVLIVSRECTVYSQALAEAMAHANCPKGRVEVVIAALNRACDRNRRIQEQMLASPLLAQTIAKITILTAPIAGNVLEEEVPGAATSPAMRPTWADRRLRALPQVLDLAVPPTTAAEILSLDTDRLVMSLIAL